MALVFSALLLAMIPLQGMKTPWTDKVSQTLPHPEYPRPTMVRKEWQNLNGKWDFRISPAGATQQRSGKILVPFPVESSLSGVGEILGSRTLEYSRTFSIPKGWSGQRVLLHFGAVDWACTVFVNNREVKQHEGGYEPFSVDISDALLSGENQTVKVIVLDPTDSSGQPRGKQVLKPNGIWYTPCSGIWQTVWLEPVPHESIINYHAVPDLRKGVLHLTVNAPEGLQVEAEARLGGKRVSKAGFFTNRRYSLPIDDPKLWSPESPTLYDLKITLLKGGKKVDEVKSYFGMREMTLGKDRAGVTRLFLNGKPYFQFGPLDQGFWPDGIYTAPTDEALRFDIEAAKKMGCNMLRKHVKVEPERFYSWCDKIGILVWQDMPSADNTTAEDKANFDRELEALIMSRRNHPSIVMWVPFNEGWGQHDTERITQLVRKLDPSRLVDNPSGWTDKGVGDVHDIHSYPGPSSPQWEPNRAAVLGEFGGLGLPLEGHTWVGKNNWGYVTYKNQEELTDAYIALMKKTADLIPLGLSAAVYTQTTDVEIEVNGWLTYDRKVWKVDPKKVLPATKALYGSVGSVQVVVPKLQTWKYVMTKPDADWNSASFNDSTWASGKASFGTAETPGAEVGTEWKSNDIWIRRSFDLPEVERAVYSSLRLLIHHDEDAEVFINGVPAASMKGYTGSYVVAPISPDAVRALKRRGNTIAIHCHQTTGGQNIDCGLLRIVR